MVAAGRMRRGSAASVCRSFATGCCASTPADRRASTLEAQRRSRRALAEVVEAGPPGGRPCAAQGPGAVALGDVRHRRDSELKPSARPRHYAQNELPRLLPSPFPRSGRGSQIELWWQDEARIGQPHTPMGRRGTRPRAPRRTEWAYIFGAICPAKGKGAGLVMPRHRRHAAHLIEISAAVDPGAHAVRRRSGGWHLTKLAIPDNITVLALPPRSPE